MMPFLKKRWVRWFATAAGLICIAGLVAAWHLRIWSWHDYRVYRAMGRECPAVWRDLHAGRIVAGQSLDEVIAATHPIRIDRFGPFAQLEYQPRTNFTGVAITAMNDRIVSAAAYSCTWQWTFFDTLTADDHARLDTDARVDARPDFP
ncbi:MAG: hypothetical protein GC162_02470 [Planctomycetes bacterium]|nr:hypothetical protein [Planctomycetota bacterium]